MRVPKEKLPFKLLFAILYCFPRTFLNFLRDFIASRKIRYFQRLRNDPEAHVFKVCLPHNDSSYLRLSSLYSFYFHSKCKETCKHCLCLSWFSFCCLFLLPSLSYILFNRPLFQQNWLKSLFTVDSAWVIPNLFLISSKRKHVDFKKNLWTVSLDKSNLISTSLSFWISAIMFLIRLSVISAFSFNAWILCD